MFCGHFRAEVVQNLTPSTSQGVNVELGRRWKMLDSGEKEQYKEREAELKEDYQTRLKEYMEGGASVHTTLSTCTTYLRSVVVPGDTVDTFLELAKENTSTGLETLGILAGVLEEGKLVVTHLVVPKQVGAPDSCTMEAEEEVCTVHSEENITFIGWIHTHPEFDTAPSSVDLHSHHRWQDMLPEAFGLVCSIKFDQVG